MKEQKKADDLFATTLLEAYSNIDAIKEQLEALDRQQNEGEALKEFLIERQNFRLAYTQVVTALDLDDAKSNELLGYISTSQSINYQDALYFLDIEVERELNNNNTSKEDFYKQHATIKINNNIQKQFNSLNYLVKHSLKNYFLY